MHTYLQGRKIPVDQNRQRPPGEILHLIRKLRWLENDVLLSIDDQSGTMLG
jgi:hypothetical protein